MYFIILPIAWKFEANNDPKTREKSAWVKLTAEHLDHFNRLPNSIACLSIVRNPGNSNFKYPTSSLNVQILNCKVQDDLN